MANALWLQSVSCRNPIHTYTHTHTHTPGARKWRNKIRSWFSGFIISVSSISNSISFSSVSIPLSVLYPFLSLSFLVFAAFIIVFIRTWRSFFVSRTDVRFVSLLVCTNYINAERGQSWLKAAIGRPTANEPQGPEFISSTPGLGMGSTRPRVRNKLYAKLTPKKELSTWSKRLESIVLYIRDSVFSEVSNDL